MCIKICAMETPTGFDFRLAKFRYRLANYIFSKFMLLLQIFRVFEDFSQHIKLSSYFLDNFQKIKENKKI